MINRSNRVKCLKLIKRKYIFSFIKNKKSSVSSHINVLEYFFSIFYFCFIICNILFCENDINVNVTSLMNNEWSHLLPPINVKDFQGETRDKVFMGNWKWKTRVKQSHGCGLFGY